MKERKEQKTKRIELVLNNNNNVHLSCAHQRPERSRDTYQPKYDILHICRA